MPISGLLQTLLGTELYDFIAHEQHAREDQPQKYSDVLFTPDLVTSLRLVFQSLSPGGGASGRRTKIRSAAPREAGRDTVHRRDSLFQRGAFGR